MEFHGLYFDGLDFTLLEAEDVLWLERQFDEDEITEVIKGFNVDMASGPDGFPLYLFQHCWIVVKMICWQSFVNSTRILASKKALMPIS